MQFYHNTFLTLFDPDGFCGVAGLEDWRIGLLFDAINNLEDSCFIEDFDRTMTKDIINYVCTS